MAAPPRARWNHRANAPGPPLTTSGHSGSHGQEARGRPVRPQLGLRMDGPLAPARPRPIDDRQPDASKPSMRFDQATTVLVFGEEVGA